MAITFYPEGTVVRAGDDELRTLHKIAGGSGSGSGTTGLSGVGSPEGVVAAAVGTTYVRTDTTGFWYKTSGGSTAFGWTEGIS